MGVLMGLWSHEHVITIFPAFAIMIAVAILMRKLLINKSFEVRMIPIKIISVILVVIEIGKQICSASRGYNLYHIPLHFCSIFLYILPLMAFYRGKYQESMRSVACSTMLALFIGMLTIPSVIYSADRINTFFDDYLSFHTVFFHNLVMLALFITVALDLHRPSGKRRETLFVTLFGTGFVAIAASASHILQTNYSNFLFCTVGFIKTLTDNMKATFGEVPVTIFYTVTLAVLHVLLMVATNYLYLLICICKEKICGLFGKKKAK